MDDKTKEMVTAVAEALKPFADLAQRLFGGPFDAISGVVGNEIKYRGQIREIALFKRLKAAIDAAGFDPGTIPDNIWIPAFREVLLEDDETIQTRWANLLANASDPRKENSVLPVFVVILKELTSKEVRFLDCILTTIDEADDSSTQASGIFRQAEMEAVYTKANGQADDFGLSMQLLMRNQILMIEDEPQPIVINDEIHSSYGNAPIPIQTKEKVYFTGLGRRFVLACQSPSPVGTPKEK